MSSLMLLLLGFGFFNLLSRLVLSLDVINGQAIMAFSPRPVDSTVVCGLNSTSLGAALFSLIVLAVIV